MVVGRGLHQNQQRLAVGGLRFNTLCTLKHLVSGKVLRASFFNQRGAASAF